MAYIVATFKHRGVHMHDETLTINQFCAPEKVSRSQLYRLWREGKGPRFI